MSAVSTSNVGRLRRRAKIALNITLAVSGAAAIAALILEYGGFDLSEAQARMLHVGQMTIVGVFILDRIARLLLATAKLNYLRENWLDFALIGMFLAAAFVIGRMKTQALSAGALYVAITQAYILITLLLHAVSVNLRVAGSGLPPTWMLIGSFGALCLIGSGLLMLPAARTETAPPLYYPDALFTSVSATCVTGLVVKDTGVDFTLFGQAVILTQIQLGGLGIMLFGTVLALWVGKGLSMRGSDAIGQMMGADGIGRLSRAIKFVVIATLLIEALGAAAMYPMFSNALDAHGRAMTPGMAAWHSIFHSVSSFCNAGFALYGRNMMQGVGQDGWVSPLRDRWQVMWVMGPLIILGGLGFPVLQDIDKRLRNWLRQLWRLRHPPHWRPKRNTDTSGARLSLHSKVVLTTSAILLVLGAVVLLAVEPAPSPPEEATTDSQGSQKTGVIGRNEISQSDTREVGDWQSMSPWRRIREAMFQSVTARTAGFNTIEMGELSSAGKLWMCALMTIGGSPASTAGGMKTATLALLVLATWSVLRRRDEVEVFKRSIEAELIRRTVTLAVLYMMLLGTVTLLLCVTMRGHDFLELFFEASSACGTVGLSTGITGRLTTAGKFVIVIGMFAGRLGPLTLLLALTSKLRHARYSFPREDVVIG